MGQVERQKRGTWLQALWVLSDLLAILGGFLLGYWTRFHSPFAALVPPAKGIPPLALYMAGALVTATLWVPLFHAMGLYRLHRGRIRSRPKDLLRALAFGMILVAALSFFYRGASFSRLAVPLIWFWIAVLLSAGRTLVQHIPWRWRPIRFAVVGDSQTATQVATSLTRSSYPHEYVGSFSMPSPASAPAPARAPHLGGVEEIETRAGELRLDLVVLAPESADEALVRRVYEQCQRLDLDFQFVPDLLSIWRRQLSLEEIDGLPVLHLRDLPLVGWNGVIKRTLDLVVSGLLLIVLGPLLLALALLVKLDSPGPVFHRQERVGRDRRPFGMLKFRSMSADAEKDSGPVWAESNDPRRTRSGAFLRKWSLDELPQLWNVFAGQMSLVGPRPERRFFVEQFETQVLDYYDRHRVKSGMTGWAQVHGLRGNVPIEDRTRYDLYYVENWSLWLDIRILWLTARAVIRHRGE